MLIKLDIETFTQLGWEGWRKEKQEEMGRGGEKERRRERGGEEKRGRKERKGRRERREGTELEDMETFLHIQISPSLPGGYL